MRWEWDATYQLQYSVVRKLVSSPEHGAGLAFEHLAFFAHFPWPLPPYPRQHERTQFIIITSSVLTIDQPPLKNPQMAAPPVVEHFSHERIIESGPHVYRACRMSAATTKFSTGEPPVVDEALPYTMTLQIFFSRTYELRRMPGSFPAPLEEDDIASTPCEEEVLTLSIPPRKLRIVSKVVRTMRKILGRVWLLKNLHLTEEEWDIIMPYNVLHRLWNEACLWVDGFHFDLTLRVDLRLIVNLSALQDSWYQIELDDGHCSICMQVPSKRTTVRLRGCNHPYQPKCIFTWFETNASCPICRDNVLAHLC